MSASRLCAHGTVATYIPELGKRGPRLVRDLPRDHRRLRLRGRRQPPAVHDPVDLEAVRLRPRARGPRQGGRARSGSASSRPATRSTRSASSASTGRPLNPMINAGAIAATLARRRALGRGPLGSACSRCSRCTPAGRSRSTRRCTAPRRDDRASQSRDRPHAAQLRASSATDPEPALDLYFRQCSIEVDCRDLSIMAATLATGGVNPVDGRARDLGAGNVDEVLSVMTTLRHVRLRRRVGVRVGLAGQERRGGRHPRGAAGPARHRRVLAAARRARQQRARRRGVRGAVRGPRAALPARAARLARRAARALRRCERSARTTRRRRSEQRARSRRGDASRRLRAAGRLRRSAAIERLRAPDRERAGGDPAVRHRPGARDAASTRPRRASCSSSSRPRARAQRSIAFVALQRFPRLSRLLEEARALDASLEFRQFEDLDVAIEWCEARLLADGGGAAHGAEIDLADHELTQGLDGRRARDAARAARAAGVRGAADDRETRAAGRRGLPARARGGQRADRYDGQPDASARDTVPRHGVRRAGSARTGDDAHCVRAVPTRPARVSCSSARPSRRCRPNSRRS